MKIFIYILMLFSLAIIIYNFTLLNYSSVFQGESALALIGILCAAIVLVLLIILLTSKAIDKKQQQ